MNLLAILRSTLHQRDAALWTGRSRRKDTAALNAAIGRAQQFVRSYPFASDERVRAWCLAHRDDVEIIVPSRSRATRERLLGEPIMTKP